MSRYIPKNPTGKGGFKKGQPAHPNSGRKKLSPEFKEILHAATVPALQVLIQMSNGKIKVSPAIRERASEYLVDREYGRPTVAVSGVDGAPVIINFSAQDAKL
jgi:hypothetical protein